MLKYLFVPLIAYFFYWAIWVELGVWGKTLVEAWQASTTNWIVLVILLVLEGYVLIREYKGKRQLSVATAATQDDPWSGPTPKAASDPDGFRYFMRDVGERWDDRLDRLFSTVGKTTFPKRLFLRVKRVTYMLCFVLYVIMALMSLNNVPFLILFVITAYALIENLMWARHYKWVKRRHEEHHTS